MAEPTATPPSAMTPQPAAVPGLSKTRLALAFLVAAASDAVSYGMAWVPPVQWAIDLVTALLLFWLLGQQDASDMVTRTIKMWLSR
jgi:hypothetical protein